MQCFPLERLNITESSKPMPRMLPPRRPASAELPPDRVREFDLVMVRPDGLRRTVLDTTYLVRDRDPGEIHDHGVLIAVTHDIGFRVKGPYVA